MCYRFVVCPKADAIYPIVSASSIVAKVSYAPCCAPCEFTQLTSLVHADKGPHAFVQVTRDNLLLEFKMNETSSAKQQLDYGSGYPAGKEGPNASLVGTNLL